MCGRAGSLARLGHPLDVLMINRDSTTTLRVDLGEFKQYLVSRYAKTYTPTIMCYVKKYGSLLFGDIKQIEQLKYDSTKSTVIKSLIILSKFLGVHKEFKERLDNYGIKSKRQDSFSSFLRILKASDSNILEWFRESKTVLRPNERLLLKYALLTGLRKEEAIKSFNLIIKLSKENRLNEYYDKTLNCLMHFKYGKDFLRNTKNVYISFVNEDLINEIGKSKELTYNQIYKRLTRHSLKSRINELRDYFNTFMLRHNLLEQEINLLCGRIPASIFVRHYWGPKLSELRDRVFKAISELEQQLT